MAYDIFTGPTFDNSEHGLTLDDATFEDFVAEHRCATPPYRLVSRVNDAYGDADFAAAEVRGLADELLELEQRATRSGTRAACKAFRRLAQDAHVRKVGVFCRGD